MEIMLIEEEMEGRCAVRPIKVFFKFSFCVKNDHNGSALKGSSAT
jgi:hypothetical protein